MAFLAPTPIFPRRRTSSLTPTKCPSLVHPVCKQVQSDTESSALAAATATFILKRAAETYLQSRPRPGANTVLEALLQLEKTQRKHRQVTDLSKLTGQWRLIFTGDPRSQKPWSTLYFPLRAHQTFREGLFDNGVFFFGGAASFRFVGPMRFGKRNRMEFSVDKLRLKLGGWKWEKTGLDPLGESLEGRPVRDLPFFSFFLVREDIAAARGRSGGLALYARLPEDQHL